MNFQREIEQIKSKDPYSGFLLKEVYKREKPHKMFEELQKKKHNLSVSKLQKAIINY
jgi:hypothetical protein